MALGPEALKVIGQALDEAWLEIAGNFGGDPPDIKKARLRLANAVLSTHGPRLSAPRQARFHWRSAYIPAGAFFFGFLYFFAGFFFAVLPAAYAPSEPT